MTCDGAGLLPCRCGAADWNADLYEWNPRRAPCTCKSFECPGCEACEAVKAREEAERADEYRKAVEWYHRKVGTAPPKAAKGRAKDETRKSDTQGSLFKS